MELKSIWEGWEKQFRCGQNFSFGDYSKGDDCAATFIQRRCGGLERHEGTIERVASAIERQYAVPVKDSQHPYHVIVYANNEIGLTPDDFRQIDIDSQIEAAVRPLVDAVPVSLEQEVCAK